MPYYTKDQKRDHSFDNHSYEFLCSESQVSIVLGRCVIFAYFEPQGYCLPRRASVEAVNGLVQRVYHPREGDVPGAPFVVDAAAETHHKLCASGNSALSVVLDSR